MAITSANQLELLQTAEAVAREKMIDPDLVIQAMEDSLARAAKSRYGAEMDIRVKIDPQNRRNYFGWIQRIPQVVDGTLLQQALHIITAHFSALRMRIVSTGRDFLDVARDREVALAGDHPGVGLGCRFGPELGGDA